MKIKQLLALFLVTLMAVPLLAVSALADGASHTKLVRVGYIPGYGVINDPAITGMMGYGYDYLMEIAVYTGWRYEFVQCSFSNYLDLLERGEIDLVAPIQYDEKQEDELLLSSKELDYAFRQLLVLADSDIFYDDFVSFKNMRVGALGGTPYVKCLQEYCLRSGFAVQIVSSEGNKLVEDLRSGTVDTIVTTSLHSVPGSKVVAQIDAVPFYFATRFDNIKLMNEIDIAMGKISHQNPFFTINLHEKYFKEVRISPEAFTEGERIYAQHSSPLRVVADSSWRPFEYYDVKAKRYSGINIDIVERLSQISGLPMEFIHTDNYDESIKMVRSGKADIILGNNELTYNTDLKYTKPYLQVPTLLAGVNGEQTDKTLTMAIPSLATVSCLRVIQENPQYRYKDYGSTPNVVDALLNASEDLAFVSSYTFDEMVRKVSTKTYYTVPTGISFDVVIGMRSDIDSQVMSMLNKSIDRIYQTGISDILYTNTAKTEYKVPIYTLVKENSIYIVLAVSAIFIIIMTILFRTGAVYSRRMESLAYVDSLTGLSSFTRFKMDVLEVMKKAEPREYMIVSVDINNFKYINDALGYDAGNDLLRRFGERILEEKIPSRYVCRMSSDLFFFFEPVFLSGDYNKAFASLKHLEDALRIGDFLEYPIIFSVGIYIVDNPSEDFYRLIDKASIARKSVKGRHTHSFAQFTPDMGVELENNRNITLSMDRALKNREFELYLQPKYSLASQQIKGAEALVRWNHPENGLIMPNSFIPMFERNGFILKLDLYMFEETCTAIQRWQQAGYDVSDRRISVNLSRYCLRYDGMAEKLTEIAKSYDVDPGLLEIELTESIVEEDINKIIMLINNLKAAGFEVSIDDFGSGYSSLNLLTDLQVDTIKIDRVFLEKIYQSDKGKEVISRIINMVRALRMATVAEGVETKDQMEYLRELGCDLAQGFYFSRPITVSAFEDLCGMAHTGQIYAEDTGLKS